LAPRGKRRRPKPAGANQPAEQTATPEPANVDTNDAPSLAAAAESNLPDTDAQPYHEEEQLSARNGVSAAEAAQASQARGVDTADADAQRSTVDDESATIEDPAMTSDLKMEYHPESRRRDFPTSSSNEHAPVELPPLPEEPDDTLIDEAVRFEPRPEQKRTIPSWLFEDLESDLAVTGPTRSDDPIDHFHDATPLTRSSALDRLLADHESTGDQRKNAAEGQPRRRTTRRDDS
jgi:hypothetical protein